MTSWLSELTQSATEEDEDEKKDEKEIQEEKEGIVTTDNIEL